MTSTNRTGLTAAIAVLTLIGASLALASSATPLNYLTEPGVAGTGIRAPLAFGQTLYFGTEPGVMLTPGPQGVEHKAAHFDVTRQDLAGERHEAWTAHVGDWHLYPTDW